jgi:hypothetical protein
MKPLSKFILGHGRSAYLALALMSLLLSGCGRILGGISDQINALGLTTNLISLTSISGSTSITEGTNFSLVLNFSGSVSSASNIQYTITSVRGDEAADFAAISGTISLAAGDSSANLVLPTTDDAIFEGTEGFTLTLQTQQTDLSLSGFESNSIFINDNDPGPTISVDSPSVAEGTGGGTTLLTYTVTLSVASASNVVIDYATSDVTATAGADYTSVSGTLTFTAGQTSKTVDVTINRDALDEVDETLTMTLSGGSGYNVPGSNFTGTGTITDDDATPSVEWTLAASSGYESAGTLTATAQLSAASGQAVSVPFAITGTATTVLDYTIDASPLIIPAGSTSGTVTITPVDETSNEADETVILTMGAPTNASLGGTQIHTATILNDDLGAFSISGVRSAGGLDTTTDAYLNYEAAPRFIYSASASATSYDVTVYQSDGVTIECATQNTAATTFDPAACSLTAGQTYKLKVTAKAATFSTDATNSMYTFVYNRAPVVPNRGNWYYNPAIGRVMNLLTDDPATGAVDPVTDADGDTLTVTAVGSASNGTPVLTSPNVTYTSSANYDGTDSFTYTVSDGRGASVTGTVNVIVYAKGHWTGNASPDTKWSTAGNWCGTIATTANTAGACPGAVPTASDLAVFNSMCTSCDATVDAAASMLGMQMQTGYTGTITQNAFNMTVGLSGWTQNACTFIGTNDNTKNITVTGDFIISAGTSFTSTRGSLLLGQTSGWVFGSPKTYTIDGTFVHNSGTVEFTTVFSSGANARYAVANLNVSANVDFYNMRLNTPNSISGPGGGMIQFTDDTDVITVKNDLTLMVGGFTKGNIYLEKNLIAYCSTINLCTSGAAGDVKTTQLVFTGASNSTYTVFNNTYGNPILPRVVINKTSDLVTVSSADNRDIGFEGLDIQRGEFIAPTGTLTLGRQYSQTYPGSTTGIASDDKTLYKSGGIFTHSGGTVKLSCSNSRTGGTLNKGGSICGNVNITSAISLNHLSVVASNLQTTKNAFFSISTAANLNVAGTMTIDDGYLQSGAIQLSGNFIANCANSSTSCARRPILAFSDPTPTDIAFVGAAAQTYTFASGARTVNFLINKTAIGNTVSPAVGSDLNVSSIQIAEGTLNLPGAGQFTRISHYSSSSTTMATYSKGFVISALGGAVNHNSGTVIFDPGVASSISALSYIVLNGRTTNFYNLKIDIQYDSAGLYSRVEFPTATDMLTVDNDFTIDSGMMYLNSANPATPSLDVKGNVTFNYTSTTQRAHSLTGSATSIFLQMSGAGKTLSKAASAGFPASKFRINLPLNTDLLNLGSNIDANNYDFGSKPNIFIAKGSLIRGAFTFTNIGNLDITAGATCDAALSYTSSSGALGSGCGP